MLETILIVVVLVAVLGLLVFATGWLLLNGDAIDWLLMGNSLLKAIGFVFMLLVQAITNSSD